MSYCLYLTDEIQLLDQRTIQYLGQLLKFELPPTRNRKKPEKKVVEWRRFVQAHKTLPMDHAGLLRTIEALRKSSKLREDISSPTADVFHRARTFIQKVATQKEAHSYLFY